MCKSLQSQLTPALLKQQPDLEEVTFRANNQDLQFQPQPEKEHENWEIQSQNPELCLQLGFQLLKYRMKHPLGKVRPEQEKLAELILQK